MNTIVLNFATLAVTEYETPFTGLCEDLEATADGVFEVGGDDDDGAKINAVVTFGMALLESGRKRNARQAYLHGTGLDSMRATITVSSGEAYTYDVLQRHASVGRFVLGRGIRDNYLKIGLAATAPFSVDRMEFETDESRQRRL